MPAVKSLLSAYGVRTGQTIEWIASRLKLGVYEVAFGETENYATGGVSVTFPGISTVVGAVCIRSELVGYVVTYNHASGKLMVFGYDLISHTHTENQAETYTQNATTSTASAPTTALVELPNGSNVISGKSLVFLVIGL